MGCPHCGKMLTVSEKAFGRTVPCPGCKQARNNPPTTRGVSLRFGRPKPFQPNKKSVVPPFASRGTGDRIRQEFKRCISVIKKRPWILAPVAGGVLLLLVLALCLFFGGSSERKAHSTAAAVPIEKSRGSNEDPWQTSPHANQSPGDAAAAATGLAGCGGCFGCAVLIPVMIIAFFLLNVALLVWVARDAKARGMDGGIWMFVVFFTGLIGLLVYVFSRPNGNLVPCLRCSNKRLQVSAVCPHCGNA